MKITTTRKLDISTPINYCVQAKADQRADLQTEYNDLVSMRRCSGVPHDILTRMETNGMVSSIKNSFGIAQSQVLMSRLFKVRDNIVSDAHVKYYVDYVNYIISGFAASLSNEVLAELRAEVGCVENEWSKAIDKIVSFYLDFYLIDECGNVEEELFKSALIAQNKGGHLEFFPPRIVYTVPDLNSMQYCRWRSERISNFLLSDDDMNQPFVFEIRADSTGLIQFSNNPQIRMPGNTKYSNVHFYGELLTLGNKKNVRLWYSQDHAQKGLFPEIDEILSERVDDKWRLVIKDHVKKMRAGKSYAKLFMDMNELTVKGDWLTGSKVNRTTAYKRIGEKMYKISLPPSVASGPTIATTAWMIGDATRLVEFEEGRFGAMLVGDFSSGRYRPFGVCLKSLNNRGEMNSMKGENKEKLRMWWQCLTQSQKEAVIDDCYFHFWKKYEDIVELLTSAFFL